MGRRKKKAEDVVDDIKDFIEENPVASSIAATLIGAIATSIFKVYTGDYSAKSETKRKQK